MELRFGFLAMVEKYIADTGQQIVELQEEIKRNRMNESLITASNPKFNITNS